MNEKLIAGYAAYTTTEEYAGGAVGEAPATSPVCTFLMSAALSANTVTQHC
ncbi:LxmA leader domain family RiPP [Kitasatospora sp. NPDC089509]|uniref:LxmA leader domain family RiPP n=1 Tax=Kitasatospora sp. NPDC089509 TaxID=3364079 RepID=UPI00383055CF